MATNILSPDCIHCLKTLPAGGDPPSTSPDGDDQGWFDERHAAVVRYADAMTVGCVVSEALFEEIKRLFGQREVVEITATVAAYNCVSRFLVALDVGEMSDKQGH